ncbi:hypothetical protein [Dyadobacter sp.]|uniref:hypothetical protein n=1 Tax=Dyadobacter sp. TaxID=1914288 RepID=UPI003F70B777
METLIVFSMTFIPMGLAIWRMIRLTRDTIGTNSPLKVVRIYKTTAWSYFASFDSLFILYGFFGSGLVISAVLFARFSTPNPELGCIIMSLIAFVLLGLGSAVLAVNLNHWHHVRGAVITTFPEKHELKIEVGGTMFHLKDGDLIKISFQRNEGKLQLGFARYYLASGDSFVLSNKNSGMWVVQEYFKRVPIEYKERYLPFINT